LALKLSIVGLAPGSVQGCQMVSFQTKNPNFGKFWRTLDWKMLIYFMSIWNILQTFGIFYEHWEHVLFIWYNFSGFGIMYQEKSGNPVSVFGKRKKKLYPKNFLEDDHQGELEGAN
jgi:hypothetical protein